MTTIHEAGLADIPAIVILGERFISGSGYARHIKPDRDAMTKLAAGLLSIPHGRIFVSGEGSAIDGMLGVIATHHPYSGKPVMSEMFWYAPPEKRGAGVRLLRHAERWAKSVGVGHSIMIAPAGEERVERFYLASGYAPLESQFIKAL